MDIKKFKKPGIIMGSVILAIYVLFLILPFAVSPLINSYSHYLSKVIEDASGFKIKFEHVKLVTTPKLTAGVKAGHISAILPNNDEFLSAADAQIKISLLPLLIKRIEIDVISANNISANIKIQRDGKFLIEEYIPKTEETPEIQAPVTGLPLGFKLSNHLPDINIKRYNAIFTNMGDKKDYSIEGQNLKVSDFILNKNIKVQTQGKITLAGSEQFNYDIKLFNKIMPDLELNDIVFAPQTDEDKKENPEIAVNIIDIFKTVNKNQITANIKTDLKTSGSLNSINMNGLIDVSGLTLAVNGKTLPAGHIMLNFNGKKIILNSELFTATDEKTAIVGDFRTGKKANINLAVKSNTKINNLFKILNSLAKSFNCNELETLSATGAIDADFSVKTDMKKVESNGYFRIPSASIKYALYNILINNIKADVDFSNNMVNVKDLGFTVFSQPLKLYGTINNDTTADLHLTADKLLLKGLLTAAGQVGLLKENDIISGTLSMDASVKGKLKNINPSVDVSVNNINVMNKPSSTSLKLSDAKINISSDGKKYIGNINVNNVNVINPAAKISVPAAKVILDEKDINIADTFLTFNNSRINITGKISDYSTKKIAMDIKAKGAILASDIKALIPDEMRSEVKTAGKLPLLVSITGNNKAQNIEAQLLANPSNYVSILNIDELSGKSTLLNSHLKISNDSLKLSDTGIYTINGSANLSDNPKDNLSGSSSIVTVKGSVDKLSSSPHLNGINIKSSGLLGASIPGFKGSKLNTQFDLTLSGNPANPAMKGFANIPTVSIPSIKTSLKNMSIDITNKAITIDTPTINIDNSVMDAKTVVSTNFNNGILINSIAYNALLLDTDTLIKAMEGLNSPVSASSSGKTSSASASKNANLGIVIQSGKGSVSKFKSGNITASDLSSTFSLKNNVFYLKGIQGNAYSGKVNGDVSVNLINGKTNVDFHGSGLNAVNAIEGAAGLKNALSGTLAFNAKIGLNGFAANQNAMMQSMTGNVDFKITDGTFGNIGRLENLLFAQNIVSNGVMGALISPIANMPVVKNSANFKSITGDMSFNNGWAQIKSIKSTGPSMAYYITGRYNLINTTANLVILGRLGADVVAALGPIGDLSVSKLTAFIPKFGSLTGNLINAMTTDPKGEKISEIPDLSNGSKNYKDFKVNFNGGIESKTSIKYFKWLSVCDTSGIEGGSFKDQLDASRQNMQQLRKEQLEDVKQSVEDVKNSAKQTAEDLKNQLQNTKDSLNELKNIFKKPAEEPASN